MSLGPAFSALEQILGGMPGALVAFSGGADSAFLAEVAHRVLGARSIAVTADSPSLPRRELRAAKELALSRQWRHRIVGTRELEDARYASNPTDRCFYCKSALFDVLAPMAAETGYEMLLGTNLDDLSDHRPGHAAAEKSGAKHPLVEAGLTKQQIRLLSKELSLDTSNKPAAACLASRLAYGVRVTPHALERVEHAEDFLIALGFEVIRVRDLGEDRARVEVGTPEVPALMARRSEVLGHLRALGFNEVELDEKGYRRGALNEGVVSVEILKEAPSV